MDLPQPPQDTELKNIIDKLAQFVARNGPEFEQMTKNKQKGNSKFQFLFGGEYFNYYQYRVTTEQAIYKQQQASGNTNSTNHWNASVLNGSEIESLKQQQEALKEQIKQSEQNLSAQHAVLLQQQQAQVELAVAKAEADALQIEAENCNIFLEDIYNFLQPIIDNCTKDSISNGKSWILQHASNREKAFCILHCLLNKVIQGSTFQQKLHVIYLVNDLMHHCARKSSADLRAALEDTVVPMFCNANVGATEDQKVKLDKLLKLWETKLNFLSKDLIEQMKSPVLTYQEYQTSKMAKYSEEINSLAQQTKLTFDNYQSQHQAYVCHAMQQIMDLQQQKQALEQQQQQSLQAAPIPAQQPTNNLIPLESIQQSIQQQVSAQENGPHPDYSNPTQVATPNTSAPPPPAPPENFMNPSYPPPNIMQQPPNATAASPAIDHQFSQPPPGFFPPPGVFPDFSKPPPGFPPKPEPVEELVPTFAYYDLPAGLIVPLIKLEDTSYKPLDPKDIRLPPPAPPNERLIAALEAFYAPPTHERPRDSEGWEKLGLYEYYKAKNNAKKEKEEQIANGLREKSRSPSPVTVPVLKEPSPPKRRYTSKSPSPPSSNYQPQHRSSKKSRSRSRSRSRSPKRRRRSGRGSRRRSLSRSSSRSPPRRSSRSPPRRSSRSPPRRSSRSPLRRSSRSPPRRSPTPPHHHGFVGSSYMRSDMQELDPTNKGHQMLKKMGWGGSGLGANEQGIDTPISGGDVRDRQDQFKGVGCNLNDPYENFRKNKGAAFITRMKARAEERANENKFVDY